MNEYRKLMESLDRINEEDDAQDEQVAAIGQLIADKTEFADSESKLSVDAFISILQKMGLSYSKETLMDLASAGKLDAVISDVNDSYVQFKGQADIDPEAMSVDKAKSTVNDMAKRSMNKGGLGSKPEPEEKTGYAGGDDNAEEEQF